MRFDLKIIERWIKEGSRILDLGCGDGRLLKHLKESRRVSGYGLENDPDQIQRCIENDVNVIEKSLDRELSDFGDNSFDTVVMTFALQAMNHPDIILDEMLRVGKECILTFPNFGNLHSRCSLLFSGKMPVTKNLPYQWFDTPNIHFCTVADFEALCYAKGYQILDKEMLSDGAVSSIFKNLWPNLFAQTAVYHLARK